MSRRLGYVLVMQFIFLTACSNFSVKPPTKEAGGTGSESLQPSERFDRIRSFPSPQEFSSFRVTDSEPPSVIDQELETIPPEMEPKVEQWISYFQGKGRPHMERYLSRSTRYIQLMKRILKHNGLPEDLVYIALIESGFSSRATSRAAAVGYWQFIKGTGRRYGLEISPYVDERRDPVLSTQAAAEYFKGLYSVFGSWYLAMASYNVGENRVKREVMNHYTRDFWELAKKKRFPKETVNYIPKFVAARLIAKNPDKYGFSDIEFEQPLEFELIKVEKSVNLRKFASLLNMDYEDFKRMNPRFKGEIAPIRSGLELRVPVGRSRAALAVAGQAFTNVTEFVVNGDETKIYRIRSGDSLYAIAQKYRTTVAYLRDLNDLSPQKKLRVGMRLQVPDHRNNSGHKQVEFANQKSVVKGLANKDSRKTVAEKTSEDREKASSSPELLTKEGVFYIVQPGDTLSMIADEYDSSVGELQKINKLTRKSTIRVGMKLRVPKNGRLPVTLEDPPQFSSKKGRTSAPSAAGQDSLFHRVLSGENLALIAKKYGISLTALRSANNLKKKTKISAGMMLTIPTKAKYKNSKEGAFKKKTDHRLARSGR